MTRMLTLTAVLATGLAFPAIAGEPTKTAPEAGTTAPAGKPSTMETAHQHLMQQGYTNVSELVKDSQGKWVGSATKDGKTVPVAVDVRGGVTAP